MANNRMYLRNKRTGAKLLLARYYPSTGWNNYYGLIFGDRLDALFKDKEPDPTQWGDNDWEIEYEHNHDQDGPDRQPS
jgi:hypothetical protein